MSVSQRFNQFAKRNALGFGMTCLCALSAYIGGGGRFDAEAGRKFAAEVPGVLVGMVFLGLPMFVLLRLFARSVGAPRIVTGYAATAVALVSTFTLLVCLVKLIPAHIGLLCLPLGFLGGIWGALEASDISRKRAALDTDLPQAELDTSAPELRSVPPIS